MFLIELTGFDIVLDMDWLSTNDTNILCRKKMVRVNPPGRESFVVYGDKHYVNSGIISMIKAKKCSPKGCTSYLAFVIDANKEMQAIPMACDFSEVFPDDLPRFPMIDE